MAVKMNVLFLSILVSCSMALPDDNIETTSRYTKLQDEETTPKYIKIDDGGITPKNTKAQDEGTTPRPDNSNSFKNLHDNTDTFEDKNAMEYLVKYGHMKQQNSILPTQYEKEIYHKAIAKFQRFAGLNVTGVLNKETESKMKQPRCGVPDDKEEEEGDDKEKKHGRSKRYSFLGGKWTVSPITYKVSSYTSDMSRSLIDAEVARAFRLWESAANLRFQKVTTAQIINILFARGNHGDGISFDGRGNTLAHAFSPIGRLAGDVHMDDDEYFTAYKTTGINFYQVFAHEVGHSLGLGHSRDPNALMAPFYRRYIPNMQLGADDIAGIQRLYGRNTGLPTPAPTAAPSPSPAPTPAPSPGSYEPCIDRRVDAIFMTQDRRVHVFRLGYYMVLNDYGVVSGYPRLISSNWPGLPNNIDAAISFNAYNGRRERIYIFKDDMVYLYEGGRSLSAGFPKRISEVFRSLPSNIDTAFVWSKNGGTYFTKGSIIYRYGQPVRTRDSSGNSYDVYNPYDSSYPRSLSLLRGLPRPLDAVFMWKNRRTYFFKNQEYYRFDDYRMRVAYSRRPYPRSNDIWFGCIGSLMQDTDATDDQRLNELDEDNTVDELSDNEIDSRSDNISGQSPLAGSAGVILSFIIIRVVLSRL